ncbi:hypothetical protein LE181_15005 [Streptomyces sp. SCA3-4]|uniref:hypothetical protein n=1 Tax=Streptomyces sichuanensis TaxID=2871810 RepID=UPI001CE29BCE|nr:hypothetical protein [Streptomyces sichuanensis]MCA6093463.1 hypothetical protein [Streptomyces sichuanensis]
MIRVTRTQLDTGAIAVVRATEDGLNIAMDRRHITTTGAAGLEQALNGLAPHPGPEDSGSDDDEQRD